MDDPHSNIEAIVVAVKHPLVQQTTVASCKPALNSRDQRSKVRGQNFGFRIADLDRTSEV
jgi:hypothetical protein